MKTVSAKPSKLALPFREINQIGGKDASYLANVILCHHQRPMAKLKGLLKLLRDGKRVQTGSFRLDVLMIDGQRAEWNELERVRRTATISVPCSRRLRLARWCSNSVEDATCYFP